MEKEDSKLQSQTCSLPVADGRTKLGVLPVLSGMNEKKKTSRASGDFWCVLRVSSDEKRPAVDCLVNLAPHSLTPAAWALGTAHMGH